MNATQTRAAIVCLVLAVIGVGYFLWSSTSVPTPEPAPGQTLATPFGRDAARGPSPNAQQTSMNPEGGGSAPRVPAPGTVDPQVGFGPSRGAPIPGSR